jgi:hypothetical protein
MERKQNVQLRWFVVKMASAIWTEIYILVYSKFQKPSLKKRVFINLNLQIPYNMDLSIKMRF